MDVHQKGCCGPCSLGRSNVEINNWRIKQTGQSGNKRVECCNSVNYIGSRKLEQALYVGG